MAASDQHKIGSGFGFESTAAEVIDGIDLTGKLAIVTGGYSGIGIETTKALVNAGAFVVVPARRPDVAAEALAGLPSVGVPRLDLGDLASVEEFADGFLASGRPVDILINSAGVMACPETRVGPGWEAQFATNHLGHFALVNRLWPALRPGARVVSVSSAAHRYSAMRWDDVMFSRDYDKWAAYGQSKTANSLFAVHLDLLARDSGIRAFSLHPGGILTPLQRHMPREEMVALGMINEDGSPGSGFRLKTVEQGAATQVWAATAPQLADLGGVYLEDCEVAELRTSTDPLATGVFPYAVDQDEAARLWALSAELTGVDALT